MAQWGEEWLHEVVCKMWINVNFKCSWDKVMEYINIIELEILYINNIIIKII